MDRKAHWEMLYRSTAPTQASWYQPSAALSLQLIRHLAPDPSAAILDVGGGTSPLVRELLDAGYGRITVVDIAGVALARAREELGARAGEVTWLEADVLEAELPSDAYDVCHDRAVFHFLTAASDRQRYVAQMQRALRGAGHVVVAIFALDGPTHCSGLEVARYSPDSLAAEFGSAFELAESLRQEHITPKGVSQAFLYCVLRKATESIPRL